MNLSIGMRFPEDMDKSLSVAEQAKLSRETFKALEDVWEYVYKVATDRRCVIVTSAGNENLLMALDPGKRCTGIVKVEAVDRELKRADFSNFGILPSENIDCSTVSAPGVDILSSVVHGKYMEFPGTSMSSPFVAGAVALMKSIDKMLTADEVIDILKKTGKPLEGERIGPLIQIKDALLEVKKGLLSFDDVVKDPSKLLGKWEATEILYLSNSITGERIDDMYTTIEVTSLTDAILEFRTAETKRTYRAPLRVSVEKGTIGFIQLSDAVDIANSENRIFKDDFICKPDENRLLEVSVMRNNALRFKFKMRKIR